MIHQIAEQMKQFILGMKEVKTKCIFNSLFARASESEIIKIHICEWD